MKRILLIFLLFWGLLYQPAIAQDERVIFSKSGGFYDVSFNLSLQCVSASNHVRYTLNGATPNATSRLYTAPLLLDSRMFSPSDIYTIVNCIPSQFYRVDDVERSIVIRAAVFDADENRVSDVSTQTYLIRSLGADTHGLPVLSLVADSLDLFDYNTGIFVPGACYDYTDSTHTGNYYNRGREWERQINMEFYETNNMGINQQCGLRTHGGASRWFQQKGLKLYAREEYGKKRFVHRFFEDIPYASFKHLNLKPFRCSNWLQTGGQDYLASRITHNLNLESPAVREVVVFINGEYWGIYTLEETPDERFLEDHFDVDIDSCNIIKYWGTTEYGDGTDWWNLRNWMEEANLNHEDDYAYADERVDVPCFIDYELFETFSSNLDWPVNNALCWQAAEGEPFRFIFYDGDGCFTKLSFDAWGNAIDSLWQFPTSSPSATLFFRRFLQNETFREAFTARYFELKESCFSYERMHDYLQQYNDEVSGEIQNVVDRFHFPVSYDRWTRDMLACDDFLKCRNTFFQQQLFDYFSVPDYGECNVFACSPNPFNEHIALTLPDCMPGTMPIEIFDVCGKKCYSCDVSAHGQTHTVTIYPNLEPGLYFLKAGNVTCKIVKY